MTDRKAAEFETLPDDEDARAQVVTDAGRVYAYVRRNELITEADLRAYGERNDLPPTRLNAALAFLRETGQLLTLPDSPVLPDPAPPSA